MALKSFLARKKKPQQQPSCSSTIPKNAKVKDEKVNGHHHDWSDVPFLTLRTFFMVILVSMGGIVLAMTLARSPVFSRCRTSRRDFADKRDPLAFSVVRSGLIVGMVD